MEESSSVKNWRNGMSKWFDVDSKVFWPSVILIVFFISVTLAIGSPIEKVFKSIQNGIADNGGWFFTICVNFVLFFILYIGLSKFGNIRIGGKQAKPEFSKKAWFAMLFSAGMGIGLLFWSVGEPISHFTHPPKGDAKTIEAAEQAMQITFLHWGLHGWAIYALIGLALAFFTFNKKLPLTISSLLFPILGRRVNGWGGKLINVSAVVATLFGLATSLGFGVKQVGAGLEFLFGIKDSLNVQLILIAAITLVATVSVVSGLKSGVKRLSELNMILGVLFLAFMLVVGPTVFILDTWVQNTGLYVQQIFELGTWMEAYEQTNWQNGWTMFYWAWWISWSPFVGMFIARISKGRTIREFVFGVLLVPTLLTFLWMSTFGGSALALELKGIGGIATAVTENVATSLFVLLQNYPYASITCLIGIMLVISFFITSSDSGSLVVDSLTAGGKLDAPVPQRIFWAFAEGGVAAVLLIGGGLSALQTASVITGLPFAFVILAICYSLNKALDREHRALEESKIQRKQETQKKAFKKLVIEQMKTKKEKDRKIV